MKKVRCPICEKWMSVSSPAPRQAGQGPVAQWPHWPFCSRRCQLIDLGRWLGGDYRIAAPLSDDVDAGESSDADGGDAPKPAVPSADSHS